MGHTMDMVWHAMVWYCVVWHGMDYGWVLTTVNHRLAHALHHGLTNIRHYSLSANYSTRNQKSIFFSLGAGISYLRENKASQNYGRVEEGGQALFKKHIRYYIMPPFNSDPGSQSRRLPPPPLLRCFGDLPSTDLRKVFPRGCKKDEAKIKLNRLYTREPPKTDKVFCEKVSTTRKKKETTTSSLRSTYQQVNASNTSDEVFPRGRREPSRHDTQLLARRNAQ